MKKALISPDQLKMITETETGYRIVDVVNEEFDVASPLFWVDAPDDTTTKKAYNPNNQQIVDVWYPPIPEEPTE